jgi:uncharacterized membrane protein
MSEILFNPIFKWQALLVIALVIVAIVGWSFTRGLKSKWRIAFTFGLRLLVLLAFIVILLQPQRKRDEVTILKPQLAVLVDTSESMTDPVDEKQKRRFEQVAEWMKSPALEKARNDFDVRLFTFDREIQEQRDAKDLKFTGSVTNLGSALSQVQERFRGQPLAAILLLTDGLDTTGAAKSAQLSVPVFTFELEKPFTQKERPKRVSIASSDYPPRMFVGADGEVRIGVQGSGMSGKTISVELWREGKKQGETTVSFNEDDQTRQATFPISNTKAGSVQYEIRVPDSAADKDAKAYPFVINVLEPGNRVLYVQNSLGFDFKFLRKAIVTDRNLLLSSFVKWGDGRLVALDSRGLAQAKLDFTEKALANQSVMILGDVPPESLRLEHMKAIREFVDKGGGLVLLGGANALGSAAFAASPLGEICPIKTPAEYREGNFKVEITETGLHHPVFGPLFAQVKDFPSLLTVNVSETASPTAEVLMEVIVGGKPHPLVVANRFGGGRVIAIATDTIWRWRLAAKGWSAERSPYDTFWSQLTDWLIPKEQNKQGSNAIELFTERSNYQLGEKPELRAIVRMQDSQGKPPASVPVEVRTPDEKVFNYTMSAATLQTQGGKSVPGYRTEVEPNVAGVFKAQAKLTVGATPLEGETRFVVTKPVTELTGKPIDRELLKRIADANRGKFYEIEKWNDWPKELHVEETHFSRVQLSDLWNSPALLGFLMALLCIEWIARKRWNLP